MREFFHSVRFKIIVCIFALVFGIMIYASIEENNIIFPRSFLETLSQPFVALGKAISDRTAETIDTFVNAQRYKEENEKLKEMLTDMYGEITDKEKTDAENEQYRSILGIVQEHSDYAVSPPCTVIARNAGDIYGGFTIDRGRSDGISLYDPVFTSVGLVGIIGEISEHYSVVKTILSPEVNVSVITAESRYVGVTDNDAEYAVFGCCLVSCMPKDGKIKEGDIMLASGSSLFPGNMMLGTVRSVFGDKNGLTKHAVVEPSVDVFKVKSVFIFTNFEGQDE